MHPAPPRRRTRLPLALAAIALVVLLFAWRPLADIVRSVWIDWKLGADAAYLIECSGAPPGTMRGDALRRFARTTRGRQSVFEAYVERAVALAETNLRDMPTIDIHALSAGQQVLLWASEHRFHVFDLTGDEGGITRGVASDETRMLDTVRRLQNILGESGASDLTSARFPSLVFSFVRPGFRIDEREIGWACEVSRSAR